MNQFMSNLVCKGHEKAEIPKRKFVDVTLQYSIASGVQFGAWAQLYASYKVKRWWTSQVWWRWIAVQQTSAMFSSAFWFTTLQFSARMQLCVSYKVRKWTTQAWWRSVAVQQPLQCSPLHCGFPTVQSPCGTSVVQLGCMNAAVCILYNTTLHLTCVYPPQRDV